MGNRKVPIFKTDKEAEDFLDQDLSDLDFSQFKPVHFEMRKKDKQINLRLPEDMLIAVKARAEDLGVPYQRLIRQAIEDSLRG